MSDKYTPTLAEVRRHWGLAVDTHRRGERLAEFDRMMSDFWEETILNTVGRGLEDKMNMNPFEITSFRERWIDRELERRQIIDASYIDQREAVQFDYDCKFRNIEVVVVLTKTPIKGSWADDGKGSTTHHARMDYKTASRVKGIFDNTLDYDGNGVEVYIDIINPKLIGVEGYTFQYYNFASEFAEDFNLKES